ncbi:MAG: DUF1919 domain-containing protein [Lachnospiraceae bacterium]|nr:DUF1919 domain-containing protein [Lachnospiraceae bacterium]
MKKVIVWGNSLEYEFFHKYFEIERLKSNMDIEAIILNEEHLFSKIDGIEVIKIDELLGRQYDYLIDMNQEEPQTVLKILELLNISREKVIPARVFCLPSFDLNRYIKVKESRVSIIANHCWGGYTYHSLGMQFLSPFINMYVEAEDFIRLLNDFDYYMGLPLHFIKEGYEENLKRNYPIVGLDDVVLRFNHYTDFDSAVAVWNQRKSRINKDNLFIEMVIRDYKDIEKFVALPFQHKIGFSTIPCEERDMFYCRIPNGLEDKYADHIGIYLCRVATMEEFGYYDILKLLNHEKDFGRVTYS